LYCFAIATRRIRRCNASFASHYLFYDTSYIISSWLRRYHAILLLLSYYMATMMPLPRITTLRARELIITPDDHSASAWPHYAGWRYMKKKAVVIIELTERSCR